MKIETKFDIGDTVWWASKMAGPAPVEITNIDIYDDCFYYMAQYDPYDPATVFATEAEAQAECDRLNKKGELR